MTASPSIARSKNPTVAALLSGLAPGLGQLYCRQWGKGAALLVSGLALDAALGVSDGLIGLVRGMAAGMLPQDSGAILLRALPLLALSLWSLVDAVHTAKQGGPPPAKPGSGQ
jgi:hypothetical protein